MMLYRKSRAAEPNSLAILQNRKKMALDQERVRLTYVYEQRLLQERQQLEQALQRELELRDAQLRASLGRSAGGATTYSSLGAVAGQNLGIGPHISREQRAAFRCVTTDEGKAFCLEMLHSDN